MSINSEENTDNETNVSWDESDNEDFDEYNDFVYEPEEPSLTKFNIVLCEKYNKLLHGPASNEMNTHYLTYTRFKQLNMDVINEFKVDSNTLNLEISECICLPSQHCISIIKTFWIKLIQRKWKNICKERKICISRRCNPISILYREIHGNWPIDCYSYSKLNGMLYGLSRSFSRASI